MAFGKGNFKPGGKKGPRQVTATYRGPNTNKLRPAPAPGPRTSHLDKPDHNDDDDEERYTDSGSDSEPEIGRNVPVELPLKGLVVTVTGCKNRKGSLLKMAEEMGATTQPSLTDATSHLVADEVGSAKYEVSSTQIQRVRGREAQSDWVGKVT